MIQIYNRITKEYEEEKVAGGEILKFLYGTAGGRLTVEFLLKRKLFSFLNGLLCDLRISRRKIKGFAEEYSINMSQSIKTLEEFHSFNDFFTRKLKFDAETFGSQPNLFLSPGDGRLKAWDHIDPDTLIQIKGSTYSLHDLLQDEALTEKYRGGICMLLRLAPVDYHRFHFIDDGVCGETRKIKGDYYSVNPLALNSIVEVFCRNKREFSQFFSKNFGEIIYVEVGATSVGSIIQTYTPNTQVSRGQEKGYFKFGGSTLLLFVEKDQVLVDHDILEQTQRGFETKVYAGNVIGRKSSEKNP